MIFSATFTSGDLKISWPDGQTQIAREGREKKFVRAVQQVTYSGGLAHENGQRTLFVTERAVFRRNEAGRLELIEIAPGVDLERDILAHMEFRPEISSSLKRMDARIFLPGRMNLAKTIEINPRPVRSARLSSVLSGSRT